MISVGFRENKNQQCFFYNCESALEALEKNNYDVILTDLELGEGRMNGIEFVEKAYEIQKRKGINPRISVFSYNDEKLREAEERLHDYGNKNKVFHQVNFNNKRTFTASYFRIEVSYTLK